MKTDQQIEQEIQAKGLTAPRVTREDIERTIVHEYYFTAADAGRVVTGEMVSRFLSWKVPENFSPDGGISFAKTYNGFEGAKEREYGDPFWPIGTNLLDAGQAKAMLEHVLQPQPEHEALSLLTFCVLVLRNGFTVTGESACASPKNFNAETGRDIARNNAIDKIWPLEGYLLKQKLYEEAEAARDAELAVGDTVISVDGAMSVGVTGVVEIIRSEMSVGVRTPTGDLWHEQAKHWKKIA